MSAMRPEFVAIDNAVAAVMD
ncbi:MAG: hypothetical protein RLZZ124_804, partial [Cyanobacteriota bacterium]